MNHPTRSAVLLAAMVSCTSGVEPRRSPTRVAVSVDLSERASPAVGLDYRNGSDDAVTLRLPPDGSKYIPGLRLFADGEPVEPQIGWAMWQNAAHVRWPAIELEPGGSGQVIFRLNEIFRLVEAWKLLRLEHYTMTYFIESDSDTRTLDIRVEAAAGFTSVSPRIDVVYTNHGQKPVAVPATIRPEEWAAKVHSIPLVTRGDSGNGNTTRELAPGSIARLSFLLGEVFELPGDIHQIELEYAPDLDQVRSINQLYITVIQGDVPYVPFLYD